MLRVRGESTGPELAEGNRLLVNTAWRVPATGEMFVLWDSNGLVVKRIEHVNDAGDAAHVAASQPTPTRPTTLASPRTRTSSARCCGPSGGCSALSPQPCSRVAPQDVNVRAS